MMTDLPLINPRRMFRGTGATAAAANNFVGLFNNTVGPELLVLWGWHVGNAAIWLASSFSYQGKSGALVMAGAPVFIGEGAGPGQIFNGANPAGVTLDYAIGAQANTYLGSISRVPFAVIPPNSGFGFSNLAGALATPVSFLWQVVKPEELIVAPS